jgi:hypothetical protein
MPKPGIQDQILQPGIYPINPNEQDIVHHNWSRLYAEKSIKSNLVSAEWRSAGCSMTAAKPTVMEDDSGIAFPSSDGFKIHMDFTAVWGIMPEQAPNVIRKFGSLECCRNQGRGATDRKHRPQQGLITGCRRSARGRHAAEVSGRGICNSFHKVLEDKGLTLLHGFVRNIHIPQEVRQANSGELHRR